MRRPSAGVLFTLVSVLYLGAVIAASRHPGPRAWGLHLVGFLGLPGKALVYGLLALGVLASATGLFCSFRRAFSESGPAGACTARAGGGSVPASSA